MQYLAHIHPVTDSTTITTGINWSLSVVLGLHKLYGVHQVLSTVWPSKKQETMYACVLVQTNSSQGML